MSYQYIEKIENLNNVVFIAAWSGWSDAAESATKSLKEIINQTKAKKFASIDPEDYYLYSENRPYVSNSNNYVCMKFGKYISPKLSKMLTKGNSH